MKRGKENCKAASNHPWVASTYRVESDQKDLIIKSLRGDQDMLQKNKGDYHRLHDTYKELQNKHRMLSD